MSIARDRANRSGTDPVFLNNTKLIDSSGNLMVRDVSGNDRKLIAEEIHLGTSNDKIILKRSSTGAHEFQKVSGGGSPTAESVGGVKAYNTLNDLPATAAAGDQALVIATGILYIWNTSNNAWYKVATITNQEPTISSAGNASYSLATDGSPVSIEISASDPEGVTLQYRYAVSVGSIGSTATVTSSATSGGTYSALAENTLTTNRFFRINPSTNSAHAGSFSLTFSASDGVNVTTSSASAFTLSFLPLGSTYFDGTNDYITTSSTSSDFEFGTGDYTVEMWIKPNFDTSVSQSSGGRYIWEVGPNQYVSMKINNGILSSADYTTGTLVTQSIGNINGNWHHIALTRESGTYKMWYDGSLSGSNSTSTWSIEDYLSAGGLKFHIGNHTYFSGTYFFPGYISNVRVIKGTAIYTSGFTVPTSPLTAISGTVLLTCQDNTSSSTLPQDRSASSHSLTFHPIGGSSISSDNSHPF